MLWHIGDVVRKRREALKISRGRLAELAGVTPNTIGYLERDGAGFEDATLKKVAAALQTDVPALYHALQESVTLVVTERETLDPADALLLARYHALTDEMRASIHLSLTHFLRSLGHLSTSGDKSVDDVRINRPAHEP